MALPPLLKYRVMRAELGPDFVIKRSYSVLLMLIRRYSVRGCGVIVTCSFRVKGSVSVLKFSVDLLN